MATGRMGTAPLAASDKATASSTRTTNASRTSDPSSGSAMSVVWRSLAPRRRIKRNVAPMPAGISTRLPSGPTSRAASVSSVLQATTGYRPAKSSAPRVAASITPAVTASPGTEPSWNVGLPLRDISSAASTHACSPIARCAAARAVAATGATVKSASMVTTASTARTTIAATRSSVTTKAIATSPIARIKAARAGWRRSRRPAVAMAAPANTTTSATDRADSASRWYEAWMEGPPTADHCHSARPVARAGSTSGSNAMGRAAPTTTRTMARRWDRREAPGMKKRRALLASAVAVGTSGSSEGMRPALA